jgi:hypothetical protein
MLIIRQNRCHNNLSSMPDELPELFNFLQNKLKAIRRQAEKNTLKIEYMIDQNYNQMHQLKAG